MGRMTTRRSSWRSRVCWAFTALTIAVIGLGLAPSGAAAEPGSAIRPVRSCKELVKNFDIPGAMTHVTSATPGGGGSTGEPKHCDVRGYVEPAVEFQLRLPTSTYTGRYLQYGCDGLCGLISPTPFPACGGPQGGDFAVATATWGRRPRRPPSLPSSTAPGPQPTRPPATTTSTARPMWCRWRLSASSPPTTGRPQALLLQRLLHYYSACR
jgi:hypothetical protein